MHSHGGQWGGGVGGGGWRIHAAGGGQLAERGLLLYSSRRKGVPPKVCPDKQRGDDDPTNGEGHSIPFRRLHSIVERVEELLRGKTPCKGMTLLAY